MDLNLSNENSSNVKINQNTGQLINPNDLGLFCKKFKESNEKLRETGKIIEETVKKYTIKEVQAVEDAVQALNEKIEKVIEHPKMSEYKNKGETIQKEMYKSLEQVMNIFEKFRKKTIERKDLTSQEKMINIKMAFDKIQSELFTQEEIEIFKQQFQNVITIMPKRTSYKNRKALQ